MTRDELRWELFEALSGVTDTLIGVIDRYVAARDTKLVELALEMADTKVQLSSGTVCGVRPADVLAEFKRREGNE